MLPRRVSAKLTRLVVRPLVAPRLRTRPRSLGRPKRAASADPPRRSLRRRRDALVDGAGASRRRVTCSRGPTCATCTTGARRRNPARSPRSSSGKSGTSCSWRGLGRASTCGWSAGGCPRLPAAGRPPARDPHAGEQHGAAGVDVNQARGAAPQQHDVDAGRRPEPIDPRRVTDHATAQLDSRRPRPARPPPPTRPPP